MMNTEKRGYFNRKLLFFAFVLVLPFISCSKGQGKKTPGEIDYRPCNPEKITFDLDKINENGLVGSQSGRVSLDYEFCIPAEDKYLKEIKIIDPDIICYKEASGRIGCSAEEYLCIGNTRGKDYIKILCKLSMLDYIQRIDRTYWEH